MKVSLSSWDLDIWVSSTKLKKSNIGLPQQPPTYNICFIKIKPIFYLYLVSFLSRLIFGPLPFLVWAIIGLCCFWFMPFLIHALFGSCSFWFLPFLVRALFGFVLFLIRALFGSCTIWFVLFLICALFGSCPIWFVLFLVCAHFLLNLSANNFVKFIFKWEFQICA